MLPITYPPVGRALAAGQRRARFAAAFGSFGQRTIDRRYCGLLSSLASRVAALRLAGPEWFPLVCRLSGSIPSAHCWVPCGHA